MKQDNKLANYSNFGEQVAITAPGGEIDGPQLVSTLLGGRRGTFKAGTSFAAPIIAASVALLVSIDLRISPQLTAEILKASAGPILSAQMPVGEIDAGAAILSMLPNLTPSTQAGELSTVINSTYHLPYMAGVADIYVGVVTPFGEFSLLPNGQWLSTSLNGYSVLASYKGDGKPSNGLLFGAGGVFPEIPTAGLPEGPYRFRIALANRSAGKLLGMIISSLLYF